MKKRNIRLPSRSRLHELFEYDFETGDLIRKSTNKPVRAKTSGYYAVRVDGRMYKAHRIIYYMFIGVDPLDKVIDHIDGVRTNNRLPNLRMVLHRTNVHNTSRRRASGNKPSAEKECIYFV